MTKFDECDIGALAHESPSGRDEVRVKSRPCVIASGRQDGAPTPRAQGRANGRAAAPTASPRFAALNP
jgi:hypothetical protein